MAFFGCCSRRVFITSLTVFGLILLVSGTILTASHVFSKLIKDKVNEVSSIFIKIVFRIALKFSENVVFFCPVLDYITQFFFFFTGLNAASEYLLAVFLKLREQFLNSPFTVVCLVAKPLNKSEAKVDLVMIPTLLLFKCKLLCYHAN